MVKKGCSQSRIVGAAARRATVAREIAEVDRRPRDNRKVGANDEIVERHRNE